MVRELGILRRIDAREVWTHEALDFTPWLKDNIDLLGTVLGMDLDLVESEVPVGAFAADLVAKDVSSEHWVVIENQLEPTDHSHLGQLLTYGASKDAGVFVWISPDFREEHRAAMDWLNEHSDEDSLFFGVEVELVAVDDSRPAPNFKLVSSPNEWRKGGRGVARPPSKKGAAYASFFSSLLADFKARYPGETNVSKGAPQNWLPLSVGRSGIATSWAFSGDRRFRIELFIDTGDRSLNKSYFDQLAAQKESVESEIGRDLDWDRIEGKQACRISSYYSDSPIEVTANEETLTALKEWAIEEMMKFRHGLKPLVQGLTADAAVNQGD